MMHWQMYTDGLLAMLMFALLGWIISLFRQNVTHVDSMWSLFFLLGGLVYASSLFALSTRAVLVMLLLALWSVRLCAYLTWRNWGPHEDHRYAAIRSNNEPHFKYKSLYLIFGFQAVLAWVISLPLLGAINAMTALNAWDIAGILLVIFGLLWESIADWQLTRFKQNPQHKNKVLSSGLWRFSRHPNYFGESCVWWGFYLIALAAGAWWSALSPVLMTLLLLKVSGVSLLEKEIQIRRPDYQTYVRTTNAFIPGIPKR